MAFTQLIYVSDLVNKNEADIGAILESAVRHNSVDGITGMLLYSDGNFLQVLEGSNEQVHSTYARIGLDARHSNLIVLTEEEVPERSFASWSMGYRQLGADDISQFPAYAPYFQFGFDTSMFDVKPGIAMELLEMFGKGML